MAIIQIFFLLLFFFLVLSSFLIALNSKKFNALAEKTKSIIFFSISLLIGFLLPFYIRYIVFKDAVFASPDESNYINILYKFTATKSGVISGPGYVYFLNIVNYITKIDFIDLVSGYAFIIALLSLAALYFLFNSELKNRSKSFLSCILLLITTYFIWPIIEGRPQQLGMILFFASAILFYKYLSKDTYFFPFAILYCLTFAYHILSFLMLLAICFMVAYWKYLNKEESSGKKLLYFSVLSLVLLWLFTKPWFFYSGMYGGMFALIAKYPLCFLNLKIVMVIFLAALAGLFTATTLILRIAIKKINFKKILSSPIFITLSVSSVITALILQYILVADVHNSLYLNSTLYFLIFQAGNIFFGTLFLVGFFEIIKKDKEKNAFFQYSFALMIIGAVIVLASAFFPHRFNNGLTRILNYWTILASPVAIAPIMGLFAVKNGYKFLAAGAVSMFAIISIISASRDPAFFNYGLYWSKDDISGIKFACAQEGYFCVRDEKDFSGPLSKENSYHSLIKILEKKKEIQACTAYLVSSKYKNSDNSKIVFSDGDVKVYRITISTETANLQDISETPSEYEDISPTSDKRCPAKK